MCRIVQTKPLLLSIDLLQQKTYDKDAHVFVDWYDKKTRRLSTAKKCSERDGPNKRKGSTEHQSKSTFRGLAELVRKEPLTSSSITKSLQTLNKPQPTLANCG